MRCGGREASARRTQLSRTAKSCGPDAPTLASSFAEASAAQPGQALRKSAKRWWQTSPVTRESAKEAVKTIAQGTSGYSGEPVVTNSCAFQTSHARLRVQRAPGVSCTLRFSGGEGFCTTRALSAPRDRARVSSPSPRSYGERVGVRGSTHELSLGESPSPELHRTMRSLSSGAHSRDPLASPRQFDLSPQAGRGARSTLAWLFSR